MLAGKNPYIKSAYEQLQVISQDKDKRMEYEARQKAIRDYNQSVLEAEQRGREDGERQKAIQIAKNMLGDNLPAETISKFTGLPLQDIEAL